MDPLGLEWRAALPRSQNRQCDPAANTEGELLRLSLEKENELERESENFSRRLCPGTVVADRMRGGGGVSSGVSGGMGIGGGARG